MSYGFTSISILDYCSHKTALVLIEVVCRSIVLYTIRFVHSYICIHIHQKIHSREKNFVIFLVASLEIFTKHYQMVYQNYRLDSLNL